MAERPRPFHRAGPVDGPRLHHELRGRGQRRRSPQGPRRRHRRPRRGLPRRPRLRRFHLQARLHPLRPPLGEPPLCAPGGAGGWWHILFKGAAHGPPGPRPLQGTRRRLPPRIRAPLAEHRPRRHQGHRRLRPGPRRRRPLPPLRRHARAPTLGRRRQPGHRLPQRRLPRRRRPPSGLRPKIRQGNHRRPRPRSPPDAPPTQNVRLPPPPRTRPRRLGVRRRRRRRIS
mmetsp:Transcript_29485/g.95058  ORF Transcript_29485/g.95058 Transcript_29485/m.95058 type:complete len:228 (-) Transcript_29485:2167-2850(-)